MDGLFTLFMALLSSASGFGSLSVPLRVWLMWWWGLLLSTVAILKHLKDSLQPDLDINQQQQRHAAASAAHHSRSLWRWWWEQPSHRSPDSQHISLNSPASTGSGYCPALLELLAEFDCLSVEDLRHHVFTALDDKAEQEENIANLSMELHNTKASTSAALAEKERENKYLRDKIELLESYVDFNSDNEDDAADEVHSSSPSTPTAAAAVAAEEAPISAPAAPAEEAPMSAPAEEAPAPAAAAGSSPPAPTTTPLAAPVSAAAAAPAATSSSSSSSSSSSLMMASSLSSAAAASNEECSSAPAGGEDDVIFSTKLYAVMSVVTQNFFTAFQQAEQQRMDSSFAISSLLWDVARRDNTMAAMDERMDDFVDEINRLKLDYQGLSWVDLIQREWIAAQDPSWWADMAQRQPEERIDVILAHGRSVLESWQQAVQEQYDQGKSAAQQLTEMCDRREQQQQQQYSEPDQLEFEPQEDQQQWEVSEEAVVLQPDEVEADEEQQQQQDEDEQQHQQYQVEAEEEEEACDSEIDAGLAALYAYTATAPTPALAAHLAALQAARGALGMPQTVCAY